MSSVGTSTITQSSLTSVAPATTQQNKFEVADMIRYLGYGKGFISSLVQKVVYDIDGKEKVSGGLISKRSVNQRRFRMFTQAPPPLEFTVSSGTEISSSGVTFSDVNGMFVTCTLFNPRNNTYCRVEDITSTTAKGTSVGSTTFSCAAGDVLMLAAPAHPEGYGTPPILNVVPSQHFNILQDMYWSIKLSDVYDKTEFFATEKGGKKKDLLVNLLRQVYHQTERTWLFGQYSGSSSSKDTTTGAQTGYTGEFATSKGLYQLAQNEMDAQGGLTYSKFRADIPYYLADTIDDSAKGIIFCGAQTYSKCFSAWIDEYAEVRINAGQTKNMLEKFGWKSMNFITDGPEFEVVKHRDFDQGALANQMFCWFPQNVGYVYFEGMDFVEKKGIQTNAERATQDGLYATCGIETKDNGWSMLRVKNCW